jgi:hypothetical protein
MKQSVMFERNLFIFYVVKQIKGEVLWNGASEGMCVCVCVLVDIGAAAYR